jgi:hypothetical protein
MMAITTSNSINVKPFRFCMIFALPFQRKTTSIAGMLFCRDYNTVSFIDASKKPISMDLQFTTVKARKYFFLAFCDDYSHKSAAL